MTPQKSAPSPASGPARTDTAAHETGGPEGSARSGGPGRASSAGTRTAAGSNYGDWVPGPAPAEGDEQGDKPQTDAGQAPLATMASWSARHKTPPQR